MPPLLARLGSEAPAVELKLVSSLERGLPDRLATGEVDFAIVPRFDHSKRTLPDPEGAGLVRRTLYRDRFVCLLRADHPVFRQKGALAAGRQFSLETYLTLSHALVAPRGEAVGPVDEALAKRGHRRRIALAVPQFTSALAIVAKSDLVLTAPSALATVAPRDLAVAALTPPLPLPEHAINLVWHERYSNDAGHHWLRELIIEVAGQIDAELAKLAARAPKRPSKRRVRTSHG
jgi:DNA-binding transcriptional LysR family regulator